MHTFLEVVKVRFGTVTHCIMMAFAVATNIIVSSMLLLGGASTLQALTGMSQSMACILIPLVSCWGYAVYGGLRASFLASFIHTTLIMFMLIIWAFAVFAGSDDDGLVGSPGDVHKAVTKASVHGFYNATRSETEILSGYFATANHDTFFSGLGGILQNNGECFDQKGVKTGKTCGFTEQGKDKPPVLNLIGQRKRLQVGVTAVVTRQIAFRFRQKSISYRKNAILRKERSA
jgi:hypothetical protein